MTGGDINFKVNLDDSNVAGEVKETMRDVEQATEGASESAEDYAQKLEDAETKVKGISGKLVTALAATAGLGKVVGIAWDYFKRLLTTNKEFNQSVAQIRAALATAFQPLYDSVIPALNTVLQLAVSIANAFARFTNLLFGKSTAQSAANAKALNAQADALKNVGGAAASAEKNLAGFDEINNLGSDSAGGGGGGGASAFDFSAIEETKSKILELQAIVGSASLAIGAILLFSGHILLGLSLISLGAIALYGIATEPGGEDIVSNVRDKINKILDIASSSMMVLGVILVCCGLVPMGIALIVAGLGTYVALLAFNWDTIVNQIRDTWNKIKSFWNTNIAPVFTLQFWTDLFSCIGDALGDTMKNILNFLIAGVNDIITMLNAVAEFDIPAGPFGAWEASHVTLWKIPSIPMLAQGAVIPPNAPFMAMLGDQKNGTNIEAPLSTIQQAVADVLGSDVLYSAFLRALNDSDAVSRVYLNGKEVSDTVEMYSRRRSRANGG